MDFGLKVGAFSYDWRHLTMQAFVKARGDGLGFDLGKAEFCLGATQAGLQSATVSIAGQRLTRYCMALAAAAQ